MAGSLAVTNRGDETGTAATCEDAEIAYAPTESLIGQTVHSENATFSL